MFYVHSDFLETCEKLRQRGCALPEHVSCVSYRPDPRIYVKRRPRHADAFATMVRAFGSSARLDGELLDMRGVSNIPNIIGALLAGRGGSDSWRGSDPAPVRFRAHPVTRVVAALPTLTISNDAVMLCWADF